MEGFDEDQVFRIIKRHDYASVAGLLETGLDVNTGYGHYRETTLLTLAAHRGNTKMLELPLAAGADMNSVGHFGGAALAAAAVTGHTKAVRPGVI
jgi:hypothetical protein